MTMKRTLSVLLGMAVLLSVVCFHPATCREGADGQTEVWALIVSGSVEQQFFWNA